ncbi:MAG: phosphotransferase family protein [Blautia sp.]|nr:phosphotransferase family protein [Blautia sp.]
MNRHTLDALAIFERCMHIKPKTIEMLDGGFTNISYLILANGEKYIIRIPGKGTNEYICRADEIENMKRLSKTGLLPRIFYSDSDSGIIISSYVEDNEPFKVEDIGNRKKLKAVCTALSSLHNSGILLNNEFDIIATKNHYIEVLDEIGVDLPKEVLSNTEKLDEAVHYLFSKFPKQLVPCHGDPKLNNFLFSRDRLYVIDWEYSGMVDKYFDLVNLAMTNYLTEEQEEQCLRVYEECDSKPFIKEKYILYKVITDYLWLYWHLIKLNQGEMVEYNRKSWKNRLKRALDNLKLAEEIR